MIQPKSSIAYVSIVKEFKSKNTETQTYKPKQKRNFSAAHKHIHITANLNDIKKEIEDVGHIGINI
jgi:hypothetical protein